MGTLANISACTEQFEQLHHYIRKKFIPVTLETAINLFFTGATASASQISISGLTAEVTKIYNRIFNLETISKEFGARIFVLENDRLTFLRMFKDASTQIFTVEEHYETLKQIKKTRRKRL
ncbi:unnamed protein product [Didymodactylos carnosus]|uniref:Uncharacterized protein n=1 Tax=Didymodactylos carnosus TaxID=1234261 RepID=A0A8S2SA20_9BILA|nr:unnamed protein product [Didymodactylos carnosus]CAF4208497.1 unnamed protein product [Didymodactylos carnosus]